SLTSIMSSTGNRELPPAKPDAIAALMSPPGKNREEMVARSISVSKAIGSPGFPVDEAELRARAIEAFERSFYPVGVARQMAAVVSNGNRNPALQQLDIPALVIHGKEDPLAPVEGGIDTHEALRGSKLMVIDGMGHDLPRQVWPRIVSGISELTRSVR